MSQNNSSTSEDNNKCDICKSSKAVDKNITTCYCNKDNKLQKQEEQEEQEDYIDSELFIDTYDPRREYLDDLKYKLDIGELTPSEYYEEVDMGTPSEYYYQSDRDEVEIVKDKVLREDEIEELMEEEHEDLCSTIADYQKSTNK